MDFISLIGIPPKHRMNPKREADRNSSFLTLNPPPSTLFEDYRQHGARAFVSSSPRAYETTACGLIGL